jgi:hypothetical protein
MYVCFDVCMYSGIGKPKPTSQDCSAGDNDVDVFRHIWDVAPCSLVDTDRRFRNAYCLRHQGNDASSP